MTCLGLVVGVFWDLRFIRFLQRGGCLGFLASRFSPLYFHSGRVNSFLYHGGFIDVILAVDYVFLITGGGLFRRESLVGMGCTQKKKYIF